VTRKAWVSASARAGGVSARDGGGGALGARTGADRAALPEAGPPWPPPYPPATMLRIHFLQQWYGLSDPVLEEALYDTLVTDSTTTKSLTECKDWFSIARSR
jgi:hypothetical protein